VLRGREGGNAASDGPAATYRFTVLFKNPRLPKILVLPKIPMSRQPQFIEYSLAQNEFLLASEKTDRGQALISLAQEASRNNRNSSIIFPYTMRIP
jgi:hypothetical protein